MVEKSPEQKLHRGYIKDARGRKVTQLDPVTLHLLHRSEPIERAILLKIIGEKGVGLSKREKGPLIGALFFIVAIATVLVLKNLSGMAWATLLKRSLPMFYLLILPFTIWGGARKRRFGKVAAAMLKHGRCPHCGYNISHLPDDPTDGTTVCPECGCAWHSARINTDNGG